MVATLVYRVTTARNCTQVTFNITSVSSKSSPDMSISTTRCGVLLSWFFPWTLKLGKFWKWCVQVAQVDGVHAVGDLTFAMWWGRAFASFFGFVQDLGLGHRACDRGIRSVLGHGISDIYSSSLLLLLLLLRPHHRMITFFLMYVGRSSYLFHIHLHPPSLVWS